MLTLFSVISWTLSLILIFINHPLSLGLILLMQTFIVSMMTGLMNLDFWFSYILFLIMVGGMLILFIYMTSIASNEKFNFSKKWFILMIFMLLMFSLIMFLDTYLIMHDSMNYVINQETKSINFSMNKFFNSPSMQTMILLMIYLLLTLIIAVKITQSKMGPMRTNM